MTIIEFRKMAKIPRLNRDMIITEKIDGTNAGIRIKNGLVAAQSRNRLITPKDDNHGFAQWVSIYADTLVDVLGEGLHYGEWWGSGINRGYGLTKGEKRFSLFNVSQHHDVSIPEIGLGTVPVLYEGAFDTETIDWVLEDLRDGGSEAAPGFMNPEGVVVFHKAANVFFKVTLENDEQPKSRVAA